MRKCCLSVRPWKRYQVYTQRSGLQRRLVRSSREQLRERLFCLEAKEVGFEVVRQGYFSDG